MKTLTLIACVMLTPAVALAESAATNPMPCPETMDMSGKAMSGTMAKDCPAAAKAGDMAQPPMTGAAMKNGMKDGMMNDGEMKDGKMHEPPMANGAMHDGAAKPMPMAKPAN